MAVTHGIVPPRAASVELRIEPPAPIAGSMVRVVATFTAGGQPFDPAHVTYATRSPAGRKSSGPTVKIAPGVYEFLDAPALPGVWAFRVEGDRGQGIAEREVHVRGSAL